MIAETPQAKSNYGESKLQQAVLEGLQTKASEAWRVKMSKPNIHREKEEAVRRGKITVLMLSQTSALMGCVLCSKQNTWGVSDQALYDWLLT